MISQQLNDQITLIGPNDDAGLLLRQYWQPAALCDDIAFGLPFAVNLLSEQLALVKDRSGFKLVTRLLDENYSPTVIPRAEEIEIDIDGPTYPTVQKNGVIFAYLGSGEPLSFQILIVSEHQIRTFLHSKGYGAVTGFRHLRLALTLLTLPFYIDFYKMKTQWKDMVSNLETRLQIPTYQ